MSATSDLRYLCSALFVRETDTAVPELHLAVASSAANLSLSLFDWDRRLWIKKADLVDVTSPIISMDHAMLDPKPVIIDTPQETGACSTLQSR